MDRKAIYTGLAVVGIVLLAAFFRFYDITNYPPGLFPDQAANGEDALLILEGDVRPFYARNNGREALFFYLQAASIKMFGIGVWPMFATSALVGTLTVLAIFFATRPFFGRLAGLLAAFFLATNHWHVTLSRTGFRAIMIPLFVALFTACVGYAIDAVHRKVWVRSYVYAALGGISLAAGFYTYIAYRIMVAVLLGMLLLLLLAALHPRIGFPHLRRYRTQLVIAGIAACIVLVPLIGYFYVHPADFIGRAGQVSVFSLDLQRQYGGGELVPTVLYSLRETLVSFFAGTGDVNWRHNVAGYPLLNPLVGILLLLGIAWCINGTVLVAGRMLRGEETHLDMVYPYLLLLLAGMMVPVITTAEGMPHGLRSIGLVAPICILAGTAGSVCVYWLKRKVRLATVRSLGFGVALGVAIVGVLYDYSLYFLIARNDAAAHQSYRGDLTEVAKYINYYATTQVGAPRPYVALDNFSLLTVHFLTSVVAHDDANPHPDEAQHRWQQTEPAQSHLLFLQPGEVIIFTQSTMADADRYATAHPEVEIRETRRNRFGQEIMRVYHLREATDGPADEVKSLDA